MHSLAKPRIILSRSMHYDKRSGTPSSHRIVTSKNHNPHHYVTHDENFFYDDYGIHRGQMDRLSFFSSCATSSVKVYMYDCRENSDEFNREIIIEIPADGSQILEIPPGYAHWFTGLENVVTRNDYSIYAPSFQGSLWNPMNDDYTVKVDDMKVRRPKIRENDVLLPEDAQFLISKMVSQAWRGGVSHVSQGVNINMKDKNIGLNIYDSSKNRELPDVPSIELATVSWNRGTYQQVRDTSTTLASNVKSGISQVMLHKGYNRWPEYYSTHPYIATEISVLTPPVSKAQVEFIDRRNFSSTFGEKEIVELSNDHRLCLRIEPGVLWRIKCSSNFYYRYEYEIFANSNLSDLPAFIPVHETETKLYKFFDPGSTLSAEFERIIAFDE